MNQELIIKPVQRVTLVDSVVERIRDVIESSELKPGECLPGEIELAKRMNVSRSVVREAISRLQTIGLLTVVRGRSGGTFVGNQDSVLSYAKIVRSVMSISSKERRQFTEFRAALEIYCARQAAQMATVQDTTDLDELCDLIGKFTDDSEAAATTDFQFHRKIAEISGNEVILHSLVVSREFIKSMMRETGPHDPEKSQLQHQAIVNAIRKCDPDEAEKSMRIHMDSVLAELVGTESK